MPEIGILGYFWLRYDGMPVRLPSMHGKILIALHCERAARQVQSSGCSGDPVMTI
jgi:hypothetical protein